MNERISDAAAEAVLRGHVPSGSPELAPVARPSRRCGPSRSKRLRGRRPSWRFASTSNARRGSRPTDSTYRPRWSHSRRAVDAGKRKTKSGTWCIRGSRTRSEDHDRSRRGGGSRRRRRWSGRRRGRVARAGPGGLQPGHRTPRWRARERNRFENSEFGQKTAEEARQKAEEQRQAALENAEERRQAGLDTAEEASRTGAEHADGAGQAGSRPRDADGDAGENGLETAGEKANADLPEQGGSNEAEQAKERD